MHIKCVLSFQSDLFHIKELIKIYMLDHLIKTSCLLFPTLLVVYFNIKHLNM